jgi:hypothetical protein
MTWSVAAQNHLFARAGYAPRWLLYVRTRNRDTGAPFPIGLWNGDDSISLTIGGNPRSYFGAQGLFTVDPVIYGSGTLVRTQRVTLSGIAPEAEDMVRGFIIRGVEADLRLALFNPVEMTLIESRRMFRGFVNKAPIVTPEMGGGSPAITLELASSMRLLTRTVAVKKTDQSQRLRQDDRFRRYGSIAAEVVTEWVRK